MRPSRSFVVVLSLLVLLLVYIGTRLLPDLGLGLAGNSVGVLLLGMLGALVPVGLMSSSLRRRRWSDLLAWLGLLSMGLFSSLLVTTLLRDAILLALLPFGALTPAIAYASALAVPLVALAVTVVGYVNARRVARVVKVDVPIRDLPAELNGYAIAQISDIHVGPTIKRAYLNAIVNKVNKLGADAIAVTGDLVDGSVQRLAMHTEPLARLKASDGVFFVTGNHEYYSGALEWIAEVRRLGLTVLMNEHVVRRRGAASLVIAGVADYTAHHFHPEHKSDPQRAVRGAPSGVKVLLAHQPRSAPEAAKAGFDLQLSGHTHGGQFFPWNLFVPLQQPFVAGLNRVRDMWVYTSRGTGYWGPPKRFGAPSEITLVRLVPA
ncbi:serine/threonine protein phosphatase [Massilia aurea]|uniref:Serine/threonine protein phosphatase n=1 Tax=Massilia aurea TaxID=373040 RepID=A0A422QGC7_9BURK|nr:metallophosphoesterase [Massilia aurea]RNF29012.1 serine/threonine protein phosphatase [Massilia aurea]